MTKWPIYYPEQCPPAAARNDNIQVFRLIGGLPLSAEDFRPTIVEHPHRPFETENSARLSESLYSAIFKM
jgi:hypothetical protein